ncbi:MAG: hypothetical protein NC210_01320 [[Clostridium] fimetarium]|nr:hypothetical protein [Alistipes timonensis]MCM1405045.1 hypothetical protein [[Clostridium] fimetarium]
MKLKRTGAVALAGLWMLGTAAIGAPNIAAAEAVKTEKAMVAGKTAKSIVLNHVDGSKSLIAMADGLKTSFAGGVMTISSEKGALEFPLGDVRSWLFSDEEGDIWSGIDEAADDAAILHWDADGLRLGNIPAGTPVLLTGSDGRTLKRAEATGGKLAIETDGLKARVYLLTIGNRTYKIITGR